jgi:hypothetical protein
MRFERNGPRLRQGIGSFRERGPFPPKDFPPSNPLGQRFSGSTPVLVGEDGISPVLERARAAGAHRVGSAGEALELRREAD